MIEEIRKIGRERGYRFAAMVNMANIDPDISYNANRNNSIVPDIETAEYVFKLEAANREEDNRNYSDFVEIENMVEKAQKHIMFDIWIIFNQSVEEGINIKWEEIKP